MSDAAPEPTQAPADLGKETIDFVGIPMRLDGGRVKTFASGTPRWQATISLPINDLNEKLIMQLMKSVDKEVFVGFGFMQGALDFDSPAAVSYPQPAPDEVVMEAINQKGDHFFPHNFIPGTGNVCGACELVSDHAIHSPASIEARAAKDRGVRQPPQTEEITNTSGSTGNDLADKLIDDAAPVHVEPKDEAEAVQQEEAKAALSARSRR